MSSRIAFRCVASYAAHGINVIIGTRLDRSLGPGSWLPLVCILENVRVRRRIVPLFISLLLGAITSLACSEPAPACPTALSCPDAGDPGIVVSEPADDAAYLFDQGALRTYNLIVAEADLAIIDANPMTEQWVTGMLDSTSTR